MADPHHGNQHGNQPGHMDIRVQEKTFDGFIGFTIKAVVIILVLVVIMALANA